MLSAEFLYDRILGVSVTDERVKGNDHRNLIFLDVLDVSRQVDQAFLQGLDVLLLQVRAGYAAVILEGLDGRDQDNGVRTQAGHAALDIQEFLRAQVGAEAGFRNGIIRHLQGRFGGSDRVAAVGDVGERSAMDQGGRMLDGLDQVGTESVLEQGHHGADGVQLLRAYGRPFKGIADNDLSQSPAQVFQVGGQAENSHDLGSGCNDEVVFTDGSVDLFAQADNDGTEGTVVHVFTAFPDDAGRIDAQFVAEMKVVVDHCRQQVVGGSNGMEITGEMEIELVHGQKLGIAAAGRAALHTEAGAQRRLTQSDYNLFAQFVEGVCHTDAGRGLAFAGGCRVDRRNKDQFAVRTVLQGLQIFLRQFCLILAVKLEVIGTDPDPGRCLCNRLHH